ncbi:hypothetical protein ACF0H5_000110 [Mactra antiquata]
MGRIGKPQKSRKNKKIKKTFDTDPNIDSAFGIGRNKLQNLPVKDDDLDRQEMPRKLKDMLHNRSNLHGNIDKKKTKVKNKKKMKKAAESNKLLNDGAKIPMQKAPTFKQGKHENDQNFIRRVEMEASKAIFQSQMEEKYEVKFDTNSSNATINQELSKKKRTTNRKNKDKERKKKRLEAKKEKKKAKVGDFSSLTDKVEFGEVAMAPPSLTAKPRKATGDGEKPRPGKRSLLLKGMMDAQRNNADSESYVNSDIVLKSHPKTQAQRLAGQTIKRKYLSPVQKQITDFQRQKAIDLYRKMKDQNLKHAS